MDESPLPDMPSITRAEIEAHIPFKVYSTTPNPNPDPTLTLTLTLTQALALALTLTRPSRHAVDGQRGPQHERQPVLHLHGQDRLPRRQALRPNPYPTLQSNCNPSPIPTPTRIPILTPALTLTLILALTRQALRLRKGHQGHGRGQEDGGRR